MPLSIPNTTLGDAFQAASTFAGHDVFQGGFFVVANNPASVSLAYGPLGQATWGPELYLPQGTYPVVSGSRMPISGIRARNAVAGEVAQFFGSIYYPGEAQVQGGTVFDAIVGAGGSVTPSVLNVFNANSSGTVTLTGAEQVVPGCTINFTTTAALTNVLAFVACDFDVTAFGAGSLYVGRLFMDGVTFGARAVYEDNGGGNNQRVTATNFGFTTVASGSHQLTLRVIRTAGAGTCDALVSQTAISCLVQS